jgi:hypothetical protein
MYVNIVVFFQMKSLLPEWRNVMPKENKIKPLAPPVPQVCPDCGKIYNDNKWGGCGFCSCGYYFHPEWYGKGKKAQEEGTEGQDRESYTDTQDRDSYVPDPNLSDEEELMKQVNKYGNIK